MLAALLLFLKYASTKKFIFYLLALFSFFAALLTKEAAVMFPFLAISADYLYLSKQKIKNLVKNNLFLHLGFFLVIALYILLRYFFVSWEFMQVKAGAFSNFPYGTGPFWMLFTALKIFAYYVRLLFFPYALTADYMFFPANSLLELPVIAGLALVLFCGYLGLKYIKKGAIVTFSILWFSITYFPTSNIIPSGNIFAERYLYIPSVGFCIAAAFGFIKLSQMQIRTSYLNWRKTIFLVFALLILAFARVTFERNKVWRNNFILWYETTKASPNNPRPHLNLGNTYNDLNYFDKAIEEYNQVLKDGRNWQWFSQVFNNTGNIYWKKGLLEEAEKAYKMAISMNAANAAMACYNLAVVYVKKGQYRESNEAALNALKKNPHYYSAHRLLALNYAKSNLIKEAIIENEKYLKSVPDDFYARIELGHLYYKQGNLEKAREQWLIVLKLSKDNPVAKDALKLLKKK
jgi:tetratricopeptide (TPR) repeat protein